MRAQWAHLDTVLRSVGCCVRCLPPCLRVLNVVTAITLVAATVFILGLQVCVSVDRVRDHGASMPKTGPYCREHWLFAVSCVLPSQREAADASGVYTFYTSASALLLVSNVVFWSLCFVGGAARSAMHPEAGLAVPRPAAADEPIDCTLSEWKCLRNIARLSRNAVNRLGPA